MSDRTWNRLGRRRPYFLTGAILASLALFVMPDSSAVWMAAGLLWILDASINITMEPFRAFVADKLPEDQRTLGFVMQSFFIGIGQTLANALPYLFSMLGVVGVMASGIPLSVDYAFKIGAIVFLAAVVWTVVSTKEYPPDDMEAFERMRREKKGILAGFEEIFTSLTEMPATMKQLAVVQFFTWFALPCMWQFFGIAVARHAVCDRYGMGRTLFCCLQRRLFHRCVSAAFAREEDESQDCAHDCAVVRRYRIDLLLLHNKQVDVVCEYGRCRHCVGFDSVDAVRDVIDCGAAGANGCLHGRVQSVHRDSTDRDVAHRAEHFQ
jgi:MFS family permease